MTIVDVNATRYYFVKLPFIGQSFFRLLFFVTFAVLSSLLESTFK